MPPGSRYSGPVGTGRALRGLPPDGRGLARDTVQVLEAQHLGLAVPARAGDSPRRGDPGGERGQAWDSVCDGGAADLIAVGARAGPRGGVDDQVDIAALDPVEHVRRAFADLVQALHGHPHAFDRLGRSTGGEDPEADVVEALSDGDGAGLV